MTDDSNEPQRLSRSSEIISHRDLRLGIGAGTSGELDASLTVRSRFLGPLSARIGGSLGLRDVSRPLVGGFALGVGVEGTTGRTSTGLWLSAWRQTTARPRSSDGSAFTQAPTPAVNMLSVGGEISYRADEKAGLFTGLRVYVGDDRLASRTVGGAVRLGTRIHL